MQASVARWWWHVQIPRVGAGVQVKFRGCSPPVCDGVASYLDTLSKHEIFAVFLGNSDDTGSTDFEFESFVGCLSDSPKNSRSRDERKDGMIRRRCVRVCGAPFHFVSRRQCAVHVNHFLVYGRSCDDVLECKFEFVACPKL